MPNTFTMQEWVRTTFDGYIDGLQDGQSTLDATILRVPKGTWAHRDHVGDSSDEGCRHSDTSALTLFREHSSRFPLQAISSDEYQRYVVIDDSYIEPTDPIQI